MQQKPEKPVHAQETVSTEPLFMLKPQLAVAIIPTIFASLFVAFFIGIWVGAGFRSLLGGIIAGIVIVFIIVFFRIMNLAATKYVFFKERAEFYEGFLNIIHQTVRYEKITDCVMIKTVWDRLFGTGTIRLVTAGHDMAARGTMFGGGLVMRYMTNPDHMYREIQHLIRK